MNNKIISAKRVYNPDIVKPKKKYAKTIFIFLFLFFLSIYSVVAIHPQNLTFNTPKQNQQVDFIFYRDYSSTSQQYEDYLKDLGFHFTSINVIDNNLDIMQDNRPVIFKNGKYHFIDSDVVKNMIEIETEPFEIESSVEEQSSSTNVIYYVLGGIGGLFLIFLILPRKKEKFEVYEE